MSGARWIAVVCGAAGLMGLAACEGNGDSMSSDDRMMDSGSSMTVPAVDTVSGPSRATVGDRAPDFTLRDLDGDMHSLSRYTSQGKVVVLEWFNPKCPFVVKHYRDSDAQTMNELADRYEGEDVVWLRVNSGAPGKQGHGMELNRDVQRDWNIDGPILVDETGTVGRAYGAKHTPEMYIIDTNGTLVYHGAIDNNRGTSEPGDQNYVDQALQDVLAGNDVRLKSTRAYGCSVKYGT